jgi:hypothetical protein
VRLLLVLLIVPQLTVRLIVRVTLFVLVTLLVTFLRSHHNRRVDPLTPVIDDTVARMSVYAPVRSITQLRTHQ